MGRRGGGPLGRGSIAGCVGLDRSIIRGDQSEDLPGIFVSIR